MSAHRLELRETLLEIGRGLYVKANSELNMAEPKGCPRDRAIHHATTARALIVASDVIREIAKGIET